MRAHGFYEVSVSFIFLLCATYYFCRTSATYDLTRADERGLRPLHVTAETGVVRLRARCATPIACGKIGILGE